MGRIVSIKTHYIVARQDDGRIQIVPKAGCDMEFAVGDEVDIFIDDTKITLRKKAPTPEQAPFQNDPVNYDEQTNNDVRHTVKTDSSSEKLEPKILNGEKLPEGPSNMIPSVKVDKPSFFEKFKSSIHKIFKKSPKQTAHLNLQANEEKLLGENLKNKLTEADSTSTIQNKVMKKNYFQLSKCAVASIPGGQISEIEDNLVVIIKEDGNIQKILKSHLNFEPTIGDMVGIFSNGMDLIIVKKVACPIFFYKKKLDSVKN